MVGIDVAGDLYMPVYINRSQKHRALVVGHPFTGVKEQTSGLHAKKMAEMGYIALVFDASFWGDSGGEPRNIEIPEIRVEDFCAAVDFLSDHPLIDPQKTGVIGICGGGGYSVSAAAIDHRIKAVATVSMYDLGRARRQGLGDIISYEQRMNTLDDIAERRTLEFRGEVCQNMPSVPLKPSPGDTENTRNLSYLSKALSSTATPGMAGCAHIQRRTSRLPKTTALPMLLSTSLILKAKSACRFWVAHM